MSNSWKKSAQVVAAASLAVLMGQTLGPNAASAVDPSAVVVQAVKAKAKLLKPNLMVLKASDLYIQRTGSGRYLRFESALGNIGRGPIEVRPNRARRCPRGQHHATQVIYRDVDGSRRFRRSVDTKVGRRSAGCMIFHPAHDHWHFEAASRYKLYEPGRRRDIVRVAQRKMSFCLRDSERAPQRYGSFRQPEYYGACAKHSPQGISPGWVDVYQSFLAGQALKLPRKARNGLYCLAIKVDPQNQLVESNNKDNTSVRAFRLEGDRILFRKVRRCT